MGLTAEDLVTLREEFAPQDGGVEAVEDRVELQRGCLVDGGPDSA